LNPPATQQQIYETLMESQWWPADRLGDYQHNLLEQLVRHAAANAPFYKGRLDMLFSASGRIDWRRWLEVPIVRRQDLIDRRIAMHSRTLPVGHAPVGTGRSSGSTGVVVFVTGTAQANRANNAARWRAQQRFGLDWGGNLCSCQEVDHHDAPWPDGRHLGTFGPPWLAAGGEAWSLYRGTPAEQIFEFVSRKGCTCLAAGGKTAHALALEAERLRLELRLEAILASGEGCDQEDRDICQRVFGAKLLEHYSSNEMGQGAQSCELGKLHVNDELLLLEILDDNGQPCPEGVAGRVVVTPFHSMAQPLIRYEQGDIARFGAPCPCGRASRTLDTVVGRITAIFRHPDGRAVSRLLPLAAKRALRSAMVQVAQTGPTVFEMRYVPEGPTAWPDEVRVTEIFRQEYFDDAEIHFVRMDRIPPGPSGKIVLYANEYQDRLRAGERAV
jgi:phenylacetate-CoA ligase